MTAVASAFPLRSGPAPQPTAGRFEVLGVPVSAIDLAQAVATVEGWIERHERHFVCVTGAHGVIESSRNPELRRCFEAAGLVTPDGMPLVWIAHMRGLASVGRVYGPDLMLALSARPKHRHFYFGGGAGTAEALEARLTERNPGLAVVGRLTPPFRPMSPDEEEAMIATINEARPDILWIGLSTPKQDLWMLRHRAKLEVPVIVGVGAAFDFLSGRKTQAPAILRRSGLEWAFRLASEPHRLFRRYADIVPRFALVLAVEALRNLKVANKRYSHSEPFKKRSGVSQGSISTEETSPS